MALTLSRIARGQNNPNATTSLTQGQFPSFTRTTQDQFPSSTLSTQGQFPSSTLTNRGQLPGTTQLTQGQLPSSIYTSHTQHIKGTDTIFTSQDPLQQITTAQRPQCVMSNFLDRSMPNLDNSLVEPSFNIPGPAVKFFTTQISTFGGSEDEDVEQWINKIEDIADNYNIPHIVRLTAATSKLTKTARRWLDVESSDVNKSWATFKQTIIAMFHRKLTYSTMMRKIESRRWNSFTESFHEYAMEKLFLMKKLTLPEDQKIQLLINGINNQALRAAVAASDYDSVSHLLHKMQQTTAAFQVDSHKFNPSGLNKTEKTSGYNTNKYKSDPISSTKADSSSKSKEKIFCTYCRKPNHSREDCFKLRKKDSEKPAQQKSTTVSAVHEESSNTDNIVACVSS